MDLRKTLCEGIVWI